MAVGLFGGSGAVLLGLRLVVPLLSPAVWLCGVALAHISAFMVLCQPFCECESVLRAKSGINAGIMGRFGVIGWG